MLLKIFTNIFFLILTCGFFYKNFLKKISNVCQPNCNFLNPYLNYIEQNLTDISLA